MFNNKEQIEPCIKCQEFRAKCENSSRRKRKGSKVENSRRSAEQVEENIRSLKKIKKIVKRDQIHYLNDLKKQFSKYIKSPGSHAINKKINEIYSNLELELFKEEDLNKEIDRDQFIKDFVFERDMIQPEFQYLDLENQLKPKGFMQMFKSSFKNRPVESDLNPTPLKKEGLNTNTHSIFPTYRMIDESTISKMELDTSTYEKYMAAKELKKRDWRFNKKYHIWFKRHEQPKTTTDEYENGNFLVFDCEATWKVKKRNDFTFKYRHLEDEI